MPERVVDTRKLTPEEWLDWRRQGITGADAAAIRGLCPGGSRRTVWADKKGRRPEGDFAEAARQQADFEAYAARRWKEATGKRLRRIPFLYRDNRYPFMLADAGRTVIGENAGLTCVTTGVYDGDWDSGEISADAACRCAHDMAVMGYERMYLAALVPGAGFQHFVVERDEAEIARLIQAEAAFWECVAGDVEPPAEDAPDELVPTEGGESDPVDLVGCVEQLEKYDTLQAEIRALQTEADECRQAVLQRLGAEAVGTAGKYRVTWKAEAVRRIDPRAVRTRFPAVFEQCCYGARRRVFRVTREKEAAAPEE